jgi:hypothetical protein
LRACGRLNRTVVTGPSRCTVTAAASSLIGWTLLVSR